MSLKTRSGRSVPTGFQAAPSSQGAGPRPKGIRLGDFQVASDKELAYLWLLPRSQA